MAESPLVVRGVEGTRGGSPSAGDCICCDSTANLLSFLEEVDCKAGRRLLAAETAAFRLEAVLSSVLGAGSCI